jgi:hypothetical protein
MTYNIGQQVVCIESGRYIFIKTGKTYVITDIAKDRYGRQTLKLKGLETHYYYPAEDFRPVIVKYDPTQQGDKDDDI